MAGAIDNEFDEAEQSPKKVFEEAIEELDCDLEAGSVALDLVTRQPLYVHEHVADDLYEYYERDGFDLYSYKSHPSLPVEPTDSVFECVYIAHDPQQAHNAGKCYDFPEGRLMKVPLAEAWDDDDE
jgi:hypothetical protein